MSIVVTGATGQLARLVIDDLLDRGVSPDGIVAAARDTDRLEELAGRGVRTTRLDYDDTGSTSFDAGDVVLLVSGSEVGQRVRQHQAVIDAAARDGVSRIVYTSCPRADDTPLVLAPEHKATEAALQSAGIPFTILRNNWYTENYGQQLEQADSTGVLVTSVGTGRVASATRADFAAGAAVVLTGEGHENATYELGGDASWDFDELAAAMGEVLGRDIVREDVSADEHLAILTQTGLDEGTAGFVVALDGNIREGTLDVVTGDLGRLLGRPTTPLLEGLRPLVGEMTPGEA